MIEEMLKKFEFGPEAIAYIRNQLSLGKTLASYLDRLPLERGKTIAYLPASVSAKTSKNFENGHVGSTRQTLPKLLDFVSQYLVKPGKRYAVFEKSFARADDKSIRWTIEHLFFHGIEVYSFLTEKDYASEQLKFALTAPGGYYFIGALTSLSVNRPDIQERPVVSEDFLEQLATRAEHILVGAYDGEAVLIWNRD